MHQDLVRHANKLILGNPQVYPHLILHSKIVNPRNILEHSMYMPAKLCFVSTQCRVTQEARAHFKIANIHCRRCTLTMQGS